MGFSYNYHRMLGQLIRGSSKEVVEFLNANGYILSEEEQDDVFGNSCFCNKIAEKYKMTEDIKFICKNNEDYVVGYHISNKEDSSRINELKKELMAYFPRSIPVIHEFTSVN